MQLLIIPRRKINITKGEIITVIKTFLAGKIIQGRNADLFEKGFAEYIGVKHAFTFSSGRAALRIILKVMDLPVGSEIIVPAYTDESVPWAIIHEGLKPVFCDVKKEDGNIDIKEIELKINKNTKAIIATHIFGNIGDIEEILKICKKHNIILIEDCAHAPGAISGSKKLGSFGRFSYFSFSLTKHFHAYGGGCLLTDDDISAEKIRILLNSCKAVSPGFLIKELIFTWIIALVSLRSVFTLFVFPILLICSLFNGNDILLIAYNKIFNKKHNRKLDIKRLNNLQARIALMKLGLLEQENKKRQDNVATLDNNLLPEIFDLGMKPRNGSIYYFYILLVKDAKILARRLLWKGIDTGRYPMRNVATLFEDKGSYPVTEWLFEHSLQVPAYSSLNKKDMLRIAKVLNNLAITKDKWKS